MSRIDGNDVSTVSVLLASYNGEKYIAQQLESILCQLGSEDEVIISDDGSTDGTLKIIEGFAAKDNRIRVVNGPRCGVVANFDHLLSLATGEVIFLSDQDDVWLDCKVERVLKEFENQEVTLVLHDVEIVDRDLSPISSSFFEFRGSGAGFIRNLIKNSFMGSAMAFRKGIVSQVCPIPASVPMHDQWIGLICSLTGETKLISEPLGLYRRHGGNASSFEHGSIPKMINNRLSLLWCVITRLVRASVNNGRSSLR